MGKNTFPILLLNDENMIGEHKETRIEMPNMKNKKIFLDYQLFFSGTKKKNSKETTFVQFFMYCKAKKNFRAIQKKNF